MYLLFIFFFKQKTAYEMRISDWSSDVCSSDLANLGGAAGATATESSIAEGSRISSLESNTDDLDELLTTLARATGQLMLMELSVEKVIEIVGPGAAWPNLDREAIVSEIFLEIGAGSSGRPNAARSEEHTSELQSLMRISYAVFCLKTKTDMTAIINHQQY